MPAARGFSILKDSRRRRPRLQDQELLISGGIYFQATKSLKVVGEFNYAVTKDDVDATDKNKSFAPAVGLMLFF